jgi:[ribosomal protein S5]-alanine N-acetyltransferase
MMVTLTSERLVLKPHRAENFERLHAWKNDHEINAMSADSVKPSSEDESRKTLERWMQESDDIIHLAIHLADSDELIGFLHIALIEPEHRRCKIGIVIGEKQHWGQGHGTEALRRAVDHCFTDMDMNRIGAETYASNPRSLGMLERAGFVREGVLRESVYKDGGFVDEYQYGLLRSDWEAARS